MKQFKIIAESSDPISTALQVSDISASPAMIESTFDFRTAQQAATTVRPTVSPVYQEQLKIIRAQLTDSNRKTLLTNSTIDLQKTHKVELNDIKDTFFKRWKDSWHESINLFKAYPKRSAVMLLSMTAIAFSAPFVLVPSLLMSPINVYLTFFVFSTFLMPKLFFNVGMRIYDMQTYYAEVSMGEPFVIDIPIEKELASILNAVKPTDPIYGILYNIESGLTWDKQNNRLRVSYAIDHRDTVIFDRWIRPEMEKHVSEPKLHGHLKALWILVHQRSTLSLAGKWQRDMANRWYLEIPKGVELNLPESLQNLTGLFIHKEKGKSDVVQINWNLEQESFDALLDHVELSMADFSQAERVKFKEQLRIAYKITHKYSTADYDKINYSLGAGKESLPFNKRMRAMYEQTSVYALPTTVHRAMLRSRLLQRNLPIELQYLLNNDSRHIFQATSFGLLAFTRRIEARVNVLDHLFGQELSELMATNDPKTAYRSRNPYEFLLQLADPYPPPYERSMIFSEAVTEYCGVDGRRAQLLTNYANILHLHQNINGIEYLAVDGKKIVAHKTSAKDEIYLGDALLQVAHEYNQEFDVHELSDIELTGFADLYSRRWNEHVESTNVARHIKTLLTQRKISNDNLDEIVSLLATRYELPAPKIKELLIKVKESINDIETNVRDLVNKDSAKNAVNMLGAEEFASGPEGLKRFIDLVNFGRTNIIFDKGTRPPYPQEIYPDDLLNLSNSNQPVTTLKGYIAKFVPPKINSTDYQGSVFEAFRRDVSYALRLHFSNTEQAKAQAALNSSKLRKTLAKTKDAALNKIFAAQQDRNIRFTTHDLDSEAETAFVKQQVVPVMQIVNENFNLVFNNFASNVEQLIRDKRADDEVFASLNPFDQYRICWDNSFALFESNLRTALIGVIKDGELAVDIDSLDLLIGTMRETIIDGFEMQIATAQGLVLNLNRARHDLHSFQPNELIFARQDESSDVHDWVDLIDGNVSSYQNEQRDINVTLKDTPELKKWIFELMSELRSYKPNAGPDWMRERGSISGYFDVEKMAAYAFPVVQKVLGKESLQKGQRDHLRIPIKDLLETAGHPASGEVKDGFAHRQLVIKTWPEISESWKKNVPAPTEVERIAQFSKTEIENIVREVAQLLSKESALRLEIMQSMEHRFGVHHDFAFEYSKFFMNNLVTGNEPISAMDWNSAMRKEFYAYYFNEENHQTNDSAGKNGHVGTVLTNIVGAYLDAKPNIVEADGSKAIEDFSMFHTHRNPPDEARAHKPNNYDFMYTGTNPPERIKKTLTVLLAWYLEHNGNIPVQNFWEYLKKELMKDTISTELTTMAHHGVGYPFLSELDKWVPLMNTYLNENQQAVINNYNSSDPSVHRLNDADFIHNLFLQIADARINELLDNPSAREYAYQIKFAQQIPGDVLGAFAAVNFDKDNWPTKESAKPLLRAFAPDVNGDVINLRVGLVQGEQGLYYSQFNNLGYAAVHDMWDAQSTKFYREGAFGVHSPAGCGGWYNRRYERLFEVARTVLDIQPVKSKRTSPVFWKRILAHSLASAGTFAPTIAMSTAVYLYGQPILASVFGSILPATFIGLLPLMIGSVITMLAIRLFYNRLLDIGIRFARKWDEAMEDADWIYSLGASLANNGTVSRSEIFPKYYQYTEKMAPLFKDYIALDKLEFKSSVTKKDLDELANQGLPSELIVILKKAHRTAPFLKAIGKILVAKASGFRPTRVAGRLEYSKGNSSVEDYRQKAEFIKSHIMSIQNPSVIFQAEAESNDDVVFEVQFPRWNNAHIELIVAELIDDKYFRKYLEDNHLSLGVFGKSLRVFRESAADNRYPMNNLYALEFSKTMGIFLVSGISAFNFLLFPSYGIAHIVTMAAPLLGISVTMGTAILAGIMGWIFINAGIGIVEYLAIKSHISEHKRHLGFSRYDERMASARFNTINGTLNPKIIETLTSLSKAAFISSEPVKRAFHRAFGDLYLREVDQAKELFGKWEPLVKARSRAMSKADSADTLQVLSDIQLTIKLVKKTLQDYGQVPKARALVTSLVKDDLLKRLNNLPQADASQQVQVSNSLGLINERVLPHIRPEYISDSDEVAITKALYDLQTKLKKYTKSYKPSLTSKISTLFSAQDAQLAEAKWDFRLGKLGLFNERLSWRYEYMRKRLPVYAIQASQVWLISHLTTGPFLSVGLAAGLLLDRSLPMLGKAFSKVTPGNWNIAKHSQNIQFRQVAFWLPIYSSAIATQIVTYVGTMTISLPLMLMGMSTLFVYFIWRSWLETYNDPKMFIEKGKISVEPSGEFLQASST